MDNKFVIKDLYLASLLYTKGAKFIGLNRQGQVCWFVFEDKDLCVELQQKFFAKEVDVNAKEFSDAIKTLKGLVFSDQ